MKLQGNGEKMFPQTLDPAFFSHDTDGLWFQPFLSNPTYVYGLDCIPFVVKKGFVVTTTHTIPISLEMFTLLEILWRKMG